MAGWRRGACAIELGGIGGTEVGDRAKGCCCVDGIGKKSRRMKVFLSRQIVIAIEWPR